MSNAGWKPELKVYKFAWTAAVNGGVGTTSLGNLPDNFVITRVVADVITALVGGGSLVIGEDGGGDADGYFTDLDAATGAINGTGALVYNSTDKIMIPAKVAAAKDGVLSTVASTLYSAGAINFYFEGYQA